MKVRAGVQLYGHSFLISAIDGRDWSASRSGRYIILYTLDNRLNGHNNRSRYSGEETNILPLPGIESRYLGLQTRSLVSCNCRRDAVQCFGHDAVICCKLERQGQDCELFKSL
jgi:hypothetical protein